MTKTRTILALALALLPVCAQAENWPQWRGPLFNGSTTETDLPTKWSNTENVAWHLDLPGPSAATPAIWNDKVFVSSTDSQNKDLLAYCINRADGKVLWKNVAVSGSDQPVGKNNMGSPSPITDGKTVWFFYGTGHLVAYDMEGKPLWQRNIQQDHGRFSLMWGYGSSPLLYKDKLYVPVLRRTTSYNKEEKLDKPLDSFLLAIDPATGKDLWKHIRPTDAKEETQESYSTPIPYEGKNGSEILVTGGDYVTSHKADTGEEVWRFGGWNPTKIGHWRLVVSAVAGDGLIYGAGPKRAPLFAIKAGGAGDISTSHQAWEYKTFPPDVCTPLYYNKALYVLDGDKKMLAKLDSQTGAVKWEGSLYPPAYTGPKAVFSASATAADGKIYCINEGGDVVICDAGDEFKIINTIPMGEGKIFASIAIAHKQLYIRTAKGLYCIGK